MNLCNRGHTEIAFAQPGCPMCEMINNHDIKVRRMAADLENIVEQRDSAQATLRTWIDADLAANAHRYPVIP